ncbi:MAG: 6-phosphofructokinase [Anaerolineales bacterium]|nr:6-phosphofructokinase [Anaerolineales bacterium]
MNIQKKEINKIGILVGGGPAPGINSVIHSATIEAINNHIEVAGIYEGFKYLMQGEFKARPLEINDISRIHLRGGSILYTSRANPTKSDNLLKNCVVSLQDAGIDALVAIGGDDTAFSAYRVARYAQENMNIDLRTVHVPKTIDNDLPLPSGIRTFGFETARDLGTQIVRNLSEDALTGQRWFLVVSMGRKAGHLALGIGKSAGATLTLIPEEWNNRPIRLQEVTDILTTTVLKRMALGKPYGLVLVAEGIIEQMAIEDLSQLEDVERDEHGHIALSEINCGDVLKEELVNELKALGIKMRIVSKDIGYEVRCADPNAFDIDYTRSLGEAAIEFLINGGTNATITIQDDQLTPMPFDTMMDPNTGRTEVRMVKLNSFTYHSATKFMIRLTPDDANDPELLEKMVSLTNLSKDSFMTKYGYLMNKGVRPF